MTELFNLNRSVAVVTGAGQGNGFAIAQGLVAAGADVIGVDLRFPSEQKGVRQLVGSVAAEETLNQVRGQLTASDFSHLILVNNAGVTFPQEGRYAESSWRRTLEINLTAPFLWIEGLADVFRATKSGSIINITSLAAERAFPNNPAYIASKGGLKMLSKYYARTLGPSGVRVNNLGPGYIVTEMTRESYADEITRHARARHTFLGRWGNPYDLVGACTFLAAPASAYITGQDLYVDGGWTANGLVQMG